MMDIEQVLKREMMETRKMATDDQATAKRLIQDGFVSVESSDL